MAILRRLIKLLAFLAGLVAVYFLVALALTVAFFPLGVALLQLPGQIPALVSNLRSPRLPEGDFLFEKRIVEDYSDSEDDAEPRSLYPGPVVQDKDSPERHKYQFFKDVDFTQYEDDVSRMTDGKYRILKYSESLGAAEDDEMLSFVKEVYRFTDVDGKYFTVIPLVYNENAKGKDNPFYSRLQSKIQPYTQYDLDTKNSIQTKYFFMQHFYAETDEGSKYLQADPKDIPLLYHPYSGCILKMTVVQEEKGPEGQRSFEDVETYEAFPFEGQACEAKKITDFHDATAHLADPVFALEILDSDKLKLENGSYFTGELSPIKKYFTTSETSVDDYARADTPPKFKTFLDINGVLVDDSPVAMLLKNEFISHYLLSSTYEGGKIFFGKHSITFQEGSTAVLPVSSEEQLLYVSRTGEQCFFPKTNCQFNETLNLLSLSGEVRQIFSLDGIRRLNSTIIREIALSNSGHTVAVIRKADKYYLVVDGKKSEPYKLLKNIKVEDASIKVHATDFNGTKYELRLEVGSR